MKIDLKRKAILLFFILAGINGETTAQKYYLLGEGELLMLSEQGDLKLSAAFPGEGLSSAKLGYSPINHLSITSSFLYDKTSDQNFGPFGPYDQITKGFNTNVAVGSYYFFATKNPSSSRFFMSKNITMDQGFLFDLYGGYSYGKINNFYDRGAKSHFDTHKFYLQAGVHWVFRIGTISYAFRAVRLDYGNGRANGDLAEQEIRDIFNGIQVNTPFSFYESSFRYQIGIRQVRIYTGVTTKHQKDDIRPHSEKRVVITAGLIFELDEIFKKKPAEETMLEQDSQKNTP